MADSIRGRPEVSMFNMCRGGCYTFPLNDSLYPCYVAYNAECLARKVSSTIFRVFSMT